MPVKNEQLLSAYKNAILKSNEAEKAAGAYNLLLSQARAERLAPPGYSIDFLGDGKVKPEAQCKRTLDNAPLFDKGKK